MNFLILYSILYQRITGTSHINHVIHLWNLLVVFRHLTYQTFLFLSPAVLMVLFFTCDFSHLNYLFLHMIFFTIHFHMWFLYNSLFSNVIFFTLLFFAIFHVFFFFTCIFFPHVNATQFIIFTYFYFSRSVFLPPDFFFTCRACGFIFHMWFSHMNNSFSQVFAYCLHVVTCVYLSSGYNIFKCTGDHSHNYLWLVCDFLVGVTAYYYIVSAVKHY